MPINCICPKCRKPLSIEDKYAGQPMRCPMCAAMFQSPSLAAVATAGQTNPFATSAPYQGPAPPWEQARKDAAAPEWPWLVKPAVQAPIAQQELEQLSPVAEAIRLAPGWHMVLRGLTLMPPSLIMLYSVVVLAFLFIMLFRPEPDILRVVLLVVIPVTIIGALAVIAGQGMCCLVPVESRLRPWAVAAAIALFFGLLASLMVVVFTLVLQQPGWEDAHPQLAGFVRAMLGIGTFGGILLLIGGGIVFLLFLRGIAKLFNAKRMAQHLLWYIIFFALSPALVFFVRMLFSGTAVLLGVRDDLGQTALTVIHWIVQFVLILIVLGGFLFMLRDVRNTIERAIAPTKI